MKVTGLVALAMGVITTGVSAVLANIAFTGGAWTPFAALAATGWVAILITAAITDILPDVSIYLIGWLVAAVATVIVGWLFYLTSSVYFWPTWGFGVAVYIISTLVSAGCRRLVIMVRHESCESDLRVTLRTTHRRPP